MSPKRKIVRKCLHATRAIAGSGKVSFSPEVGAWDDIKEFEVCLDCGRTVRSAPRKPTLFTGHMGVMFGFRDMVTREFTQGVDF